MPETTIQVFATGSQDAAWQARNCDQCRKRATTQAVETTTTCPTAQALLVAYWTEGTVEPAIAQRMGYPGPTAAYTWPCPEREALPVLIGNENDGEGD